MTVASCTNGDAETKPPTEVSTENPTEGSATDTIETPTPDIAESIKPSSTPTSFPGKIGIITNSTDADHINHGGIESIIKKYDYENYKKVTDFEQSSNDMKITHRIWRYNLPETFLLPLRDISEDEDINTIITVPTIYGVWETLKEIKVNRDDIFYICINSWDEFADIASQADIVIQPDFSAMGASMVRQAKKMGASTFVHYTFPHLLSNTEFTSRQEQIKRECVKLNIEFIDAVYTPTSDSAAERIQFLEEDVPKMVKKYGKDTAFCNIFPSYNYNIILQSVIDSEAIYIQAHEESFYAEFSESLGIDVYGNGHALISADELKTKIIEALSEKNMLGRTAALPVPPQFMLTDISVNYAIKRLNGEVPEEGVDIEVLTQLMTDYAGVQVYLTPYTDSETGVTYDNYLMMEMDYITFE